MKSAALAVALLGSSAVSAIEARIAEPVTITSEVIVTRTFTVTTFQEAGPTNGKMFADRSVNATQGSGHKRPHGGRPAASQLEHMHGFHGAAHEIPEPTNEPIQARTPMPMVILPTLSAFKSVGKPVTGNAAPTGHRSGIKPHHNGTFNLHHVANHTASGSKAKPEEKMDGFRELLEWLKKMEEDASDSATETEDSALSKVKSLLSEVRAEDATLSN